MKSFLDDDRAVRARMDELGIDQIFPKEIKRNDPSVPVQYEKIEYKESSVEVKISTINWSSLHKIVMKNHFSVHGLL